MSLNFTDLISKNTIEKVFDTARIDEVVSDFVVLKQRGINKIGLCPFHNEKTPSFTVSVAKGIYKCFGCGQGGNSINFVMELEKYSYPEAIRYLAKKYNIEIEEKERTEEEIQRQSERESQLIVLGFAQEYFTDILLNNPEGKSIGFSYFKERGYDENIVTKFQLGYSLENWDAFTKEALEKGYKLKYLEETGMTITKDDKHYDRFRGRVLFPIHNFSGKVIGFGGRILKKDAKAAKYVNSPESQVYEKRKVLYGIYFGKKEIATKDNCYLVEGYTDVISLHQVGIENVVSSSGTSLTEDQIRLIQRLTKNITILYDGDEAGLKASFRGIDLILKQGLNVKVVLFPDGEDPDSYAKKLGGARLKEFINEGAKDFISFKTGLLLKDVQGDPVKKVALIREIVETIAVIPDAIARSAYIHECGKILEISEQVLFTELNKIRRKNLSYQQRETGDNYSGVEIPISDYKSGHPLGSEAEAKEIAVNSEPQERDLIRFLLNYGDRKFVIPEEKSVDISEDSEKIIDEKENGQKENEILVSGYIVNEILNDNLGFDHELYNKIFLEFAHSVENDLKWAQEHFVNHEDKEISKIAIDLVFSPHELSKNWDEKHHIIVQTEDVGMRFSVERIVYSFKMAKVKKMMSANREKIKNSDDDLCEDLLNEYQGLLEAKKYISKYLGRVIG